MLVQWFAHLPGVQLEPNRSGYNILEGKLAHLSFQEWCELDPSFPYSESKYKKAQPVFYVGAAEMDDDLNAILTQVNQRIYRLYLAFLLDPRVPLLPEPQLSVHYVRVDLAQGVATYRLVGPFEREWIVYGNRIAYPFGREAIKVLDAVHELLPEPESGASLPGVDAGIEALARTARPDVWWAQRGVHFINDFVHCTAALENLLVPSRDEVEGLRITPAFGRHAAVLVSKSRVGLEELANSYAGLYRLRSNLVHGQMASGDLSESDQRVLRLGRILLREVLLKACIINKKENEERSLAMMLHAAYQDEAYHNRLHEQFSAVEAFV